MIGIKNNAIPIPEIFHIGDSLLFLFSIKLNY